ncbi:hypothetical protein ACFYYM_23490 [Streptomyces erythrochromogenes]|uniref:hypothetical protein n=1 Tax=Streptomyces erythrochromogenes TaxID=285574 RepID=UPI0036A29B4C
MACLAHDGGMPIEVESGYLPHHLLTRGWVGELPTLSGRGPRTGAPRAAWRVTHRNLYRGGR